MDVVKRAQTMKKLHEDTRATIEQQVLRQASRLNKNKKEMIFEEGDLVWIHLSKDRFPKDHESKLKPRGDGPFKVLKRINNNAYIIDIPTSKYLVSSTFNVKGLSPYHGEDKVEKVEESRTTLPQGGGDDAARPTDAPPSTTPSPPSVPMTRARAKLLQAKVNSLLSLCDFDTPLDGLLLHTHTLCIIRYEEKDPWNGETGAKATNRCQTPAVLPDPTAG